MAKYGILRTTTLSICYSLVDCSILGDIIQKYGIHILCNLQKHIKGPSFYILLQ